MALSHSTASHPLSTIACRQAPWPRKSCAYHLKDTLQLLLRRPWAFLLSGTHESWKALPACGSQRPAPGAASKVRAGVSPARQRHCRLVDDGRDRDRSLLCQELCVRLPRCSGGLRHSIETNVAASHLAWRDRCRAVVVQCQMIICRDVLLHDVRCAAALTCRPAMVLLLRRCLLAGHWLHCAAPARGACGQEMMANRQSGHDGRARDQRTAQHAFLASQRPYSTRLC